MKCRTVRHAYDRHRSVYFYSGMAKDLLVRYKFHDAKSLAPFFASGIHGLLGEHDSPPVLVPVPGSRAGLRKRGWDQSLLLACMLRERHGYDVLACLVRCGGETQKTLSALDRGKNLKGRIKIARKVAIPEFVVLLDDVYTTGATVSECSSVLKASGASRVEAVTLMMDP